MSGGGSSRHQKPLGQRAVILCDLFCSCRMHVPVIAFVYALLIRVVARDLRRIGPGYSDGMATLWGGEALIRKLRVRVPVWRRVCPRGVLRGKTRGGSERGRGILSWRASDLHW